MAFLVAMAFGGVAVIAAFFTVSIDERKYTRKTMAAVEQDHKRFEEKKLDGDV